MKRPIAKLRPLPTLQVLILSTGAHFYAILSKFKGVFLTYNNSNFWIVAPLKGRHGRIGSVIGSRGANLEFFNP